MNLIRNVFIKVPWSDLPVEEASKGGAISKKSSSIATSTLRTAPGMCENSAGGEISIKYTHNGRPLPTSLLSLPHHEPFMPKRKNLSDCWTKPQNDRRYATVQLLVGRRFWSQKESVKLQGGMKDLAEIQQCCISPKEKPTWWNRPIERAKRALKKFSRLLARFFVRSFLRVIERFSQLVFFLLSSLCKLRRKVQESVSLCKLRRKVQESVIKFTDFLSSLQRKVQESGSKVQESVSKFAALLGRFKPTQTRDDRD